MTQLTNKQLKRVDQMVEQIVSGERHFADESRSTTVTASVSLRERESIWHAAQAAGYESIDSAVRDLPYLLALKRVYLHEREMRTAELEARRRAREEG